MGDRLGIPGVVDFFLFSRAGGWAGRSDHPFGKKKQNTDHVTDLYLWNSRRSRDSIASEHDLKLTTNPTDDKIFIAHSKYIQKKIGVKTQDGLTKIACGTSMAQVNTRRKSQNTHWLSSVSIAT